MKKYLPLLLLALPWINPAATTRQDDPKASIIILGNVQDGGSPHIGCKKECCLKLFHSPDSLRKVVALGVTSDQYEKTYLFEATPDMPAQLRRLSVFAKSSSDMPDGIFLTHAHIGHYSGLMYLGKEAINSSRVPVYAMPRMKHFLETNGPWNQLVTTGNITLLPLANQAPIQLTPDLAVTPLQVPHRDEYSETVGYIIAGPQKKALFIPDIDKWEKWSHSITDEISKVDYAFVDATFFDATEVNNRNISEIPHPFVIESLALFQQLPATEKRKIHFIHFNHTNPLLNPDSKQTKEVLSKGFGIARMGDVFDL